MQNNVEPREANLRLELCPDSPDHPRPGRLCMESRDIQQRRLADTSVAGHQQRPAPDSRRFAAFALLPVTVPDAAADELQRAVSELGFADATIGGTIGGPFLDDPGFAPVLETAARLNMPLYLHPGPPLQPVAEAYYAGFRLAAA